MLKRPKNTDTMDDVLQMQHDYMEKKDKNLVPAAHVVSTKKNKQGLMKLITYFIHDNTTIILKVPKHHFLLSNETLKNQLRVIQINLL